MELTDPALERIDVAELRALQERKLLELAPDVVERSPLHAKIWRAAGVAPAFDSLDAFLATAPHTSKDAVRDFAVETGDPLGGLHLGRSGPVDYATSSGTTGAPTLHTNSAEDLEWQAVQGARNFRAIGVRPGDTVGYALPQWVRPFLGNYEGLKLLGCDVALIDWADVERLVHTISTVQARAFFLASAPLLDSVAQATAAAGAAAPLGDALEILGWGGDVLSPVARGRLADRWSARIYNTAGLGDLGFVCFECEAQDGMHIWGDLFLAEIRDPASGRPVDGDERRGELVLTSLHRGSQPHLRWATGDMATLYTSPCTCGRTHPRVVLHGRLGDQVEVGAATIAPTDVRERVRSVAGLEDAVIQVAKAPGLTGLQLRIGYEGSTAPTGSELEAAVRDRVADAYELQVEVEWIPLETLTRKGPPHKVPLTFSPGAPSDDQPSRE